jgi:hypothetical protein
MQELKRLTLGAATLLGNGQYRCYNKLYNTRDTALRWGHSTCHSSKAFHACHRSERLLVRGARTYIVACTLPRSRTGTAPNAVRGIINLTKGHGHACISSWFSCSLHRMLSMLGNYCNDLSSFNAKTPYIFYTVFRYELVSPAKKKGMN